MGTEDCADKAQFIGKIWWDNIYNIDFKQQKIHFQTYHICNFAFFCDFFGHLNPSCKLITDNYSWVKGKCGW